jgi:GNAT superfamily N-acetyltransferase
MRRRHADGERASRPITSSPCGGTLIALRHDRMVAGRDARRLRAGCPLSYKVTAMSDLNIRFASAHDVPLVLQFIRDLARYEKLEHEVVVTEEVLQQTLFGPRRYAEVLIGEVNGKPAGFALFFHNFSTFIGRPGIYLEDLFVSPEHRGRGFGKALLARLAQLAIERNCGRVDWAVLDWNTPAIDFYKSIGAVMLTDWRIFRLKGEPLETLADSRSSDSR